MSNPGLRRVAPAIGLFFIAPLVAEFLLGDLPIKMLGALVIQMISSGIVILGIDQNYSQIIIGSVVIIAVVLDQFNNWLAKRRLAARAANP